MAVALTTEQAERLERVLRAVTGPYTSPAEFNELRERMAWDLAHPDPPGEVHRICEELRRELNFTPDENAPSADELLGYDDFGLPT